VVAVNKYVFELSDVTLSFKEVGKTSLMYNMRSHVEKKKGPPHIFKALDGVTINIDRGRNIGLIGRNGAGKTTLLRLLGGIYAPDSGTMITHSDSVSLLSLGVGFDANASGFDNIYLSSLLQGHTKPQVDAKVDEIIKFADIGDFIYGPIKTYSSGMRMRLAFSIAVHFEPEVLLIDEALSVGDADFQKKSMSKMNELISDKNRTVVIASHSMTFLKSVADEVIWLDKGKVRMVGEPGPVVDAYTTETTSAPVVKK
jgi:teichoic acid transport system ATP-binding protein